MFKISSLTVSIFVNYASQIYVTVVSIIMIPLYIRFMGAEAYGLIGFYIILQSFFNLLDMGLTPALVRETSRFRGGVLDPVGYLQIVQVLEGVFLAAALAGGTVLFFSSGYISFHWLQVKHLPMGEVKTSLQFMSVIVALRWVSGLYRGVISGSERFVWLGGWNSFIATLSSIGVFLVLIFIGTAPTLFFKYQLAVAFIELTILFFKAYRLLPGIPQGKHLIWSWQSFIPVFKFSLTIALPSAVWVLHTQVDKLVLSKLLPLADYGHFTLAVMAASAITVLSAPVCAALMPRLAKLEAEANQKDLIRIYRQATQLVAVIAGAAAITMAYCAELILCVWTGDKILAQQIAPILILYALGNAVMAVSTFAYYLQYAKGNLRLHMIGSVIFVLLLIPSIIIFAGKYGGIGAGWVWLVMNIFAFVVWVPFVHHKFAPGLNLKWYGQDVAVIFLFAAAAGYCMNILLPSAGSRWGQLEKILLLGGCVTLAGVLSSSAFWSVLTQRNRGFE